jgi:hypothetical protein
MAEARVGTLFCSAYPLGGHLLSAEAENTHLPQVENDRGLTIAGQEAGIVEPVVPDLDP